MCEAEESVHVLLAARLELTPWLGVGVRVRVRVGVELGLGSGLGLGLGSGLGSGVVLPWSTVRSKESLISSPPLHARLKLS